MSFLDLYLSGLGAAGTPSITPNTPTNGATSVSTTPQLAFTGVSSDGVQKIEYEIQIDTQSDFKSGGSYSTPANVQDVFNSAGVNNLSFVSAPTLGNVIIVAIAKAGAQSAAPLDDANNTYTLLQSTHETTSGNWIDIYMAPVTRTRAALNVRINNTGSTWAIAEYSGVDPTATILVNGAQSGTGTPSTSITTTVANSLIVAMGYDEGTVAQTAGSGFTLQGNEADNVTFERAIFMDGVFASTGAQTITWNNAVAPWGVSAICLQPFKSTVPVYDKFSATDSGFANITTPANTHPFPSGEQIGYTPPSALSASTVYYWRVRQVPFSGNVNYYIPWSSTFSFTTASGGGAVNASVTQLAANLILTGGTQVLAAVRIASIAQLAGTLVLTGGTQVVATVRIVAIAQLAGSLVLTGGTQVVAAVRNASITQVSANLVLTGGTQVVSAGAITNASVTQVAANLVLTTGTQVITAQISTSVTQVSRNLVLAGGTQAVSTTRIVSISQVTANLVLTGGVQVITSVRIAAIAQLAANLVLTGGTQAVVAKINASITQVTANLRFTAGTQAVSATRVVSIAQVTRNLVLTTGTQAVVALTPVSAAITQVAGTLVLAPGTQAVAAVANTTVSQVFTPLVLTTGVQVLTYEPPAPIAGEPITVSSSEDVILITDEFDTLTINDVFDSMTFTDIVDTLVIRSGVDGATVTSYSDTASIKDNIDSLIVS